MVEVFITNVRESDQANRILENLKYSFPGLKINFDLSDPNSVFPCGHSVLRMEGSQINSEDIISTVNQSGFICDVLEDKICK